MQSLIEWPAAHQVRELSREDVPVGVVLPHEPDAPVAVVAHAPIL